MRIEKIWICPTRVSHNGAGFLREPKLFGQEPLRVVTIAQASPEIFLPRYGPASAVVAAEFQRFPRCRRQFGHGQHIDLISGEKWIQMRHMTMMHVFGV